MAALRFAITQAAVAIALLLMQFGLPVGSNPVSTDPYICLDRDSEVKCCPQSRPEKIVDFQPQPESSPLRVRRPAHALNAEEVQKYEKATALMRALPADHPWNFIQQSKVHCAYCSGGHRQLGLNMSIEIHGSWHFYTWHRAYLYFYERILGKLINDPSFALPFWNWDNTASMSIPNIYRANTSSLFNPTRYPAAFNFTDLGGCEGDDTPNSLSKQRECNLQVMHRQFIAGFNSNLLFFGSPYRAGDNPFPGGGSIESSPHGSVHSFTGKDMSFITKAGLDPIFFAHHGNVDRIWTIWEQIPGNESKVINDNDFLNASFLFWDENMQFVRIFVRDMLDTKKLGYVYEEVPLSWLNIKTVVEEEGNNHASMAMAKRDGESNVSFPILLSSQVGIKIKRKAGVQDEKLIVRDIKLDGRDYVWFKVYIGKMDGGRIEVGCFYHLERRTKESMPIETKIQLGITQFIKEIGAASDEWVMVSLVPKVGGDKVTVGGVLIA